MWYSFGVAWLNSREVGVVLKFDVLPHWDAVFCAAVCMLTMKHSVANKVRKQLNWWCLDLVLLSTVGWGCFLGYQWQ